MLELGCGCALPGIAAAGRRLETTGGAVGIGGPRSVVLSDMGDAGAAAGGAGADQVFHPTKHVRLYVAKP